MIPVELKMTNFLSYEEETFDFRQITNATIVGENGAGKSSFCTDAITWALYGISSKGGAKEQSNHVQTGADSCTVEFTFELNGNLYKVVRTFSDAKNKGILNIFAINADGDEIPLTSGKSTDTQKYIESLLKMNYKTFTASSMVLQGKSSEFTENMTDMERKEAVISILDVDEWDEIGKMASEDANRIKGEVEAEEAKIQHLEEMISHEDSYRSSITVAMKDMEGVKKEQESQNAILKSHQEKIFQMNTIAGDIQKKQSELNEVNSKIFNAKQNISNLQNQIANDNNKISGYQKEMENSQKLLDNKDTIERAYVKDKELTEAVSQMESQKMAILQQENLLANITQKGKDWNAGQQQKIATIEANIQNAERQANALSSVPCSSNPEFNSTCPFLKMANQAKSALSGYYQQLQAVKGEQNPFRQEYVNASNQLRSIREGFSEENLESAKATLADVKKYSIYKEKLDASVQRINDLLKFMEDTKSFIQSKKENIQSLTQEIQTLSANVRNIQNEIQSLQATYNNFSQIKMEYDLANDALTRLSNQEKSLTETIASNQALLEKVEEAKAKMKDGRALILSKKEELRTITIMQQACSKKSGVPSLIVENAVPELESIANGLLDNMLEGRLQIRLDTQVETKSKKSVLEVLRITVLDNGCDREYKTYSGAERFIIDLSLRIAMSKFLAHRAGASVNLFVLDEGVSCADDSNRQEIMEAIRNIANEFSKLLFITHIDELKDSLDQKILVSKDSMGSHIRVLN